MHTTIKDIHVITQGNPSNQPLVFIHGFPFDHTLWDEVIAALQEDYFCVSYDVRGFGGSAVESGQYTMERYVDDLEAVIERLKLQDVVVCGFSMGGYIALRAHERLQCFKALVLANTTTTSDNDEAKLKRANVIRKIAKEGAGPFLEDFFGVAFSSNYQQTNHDKIVLWKEKILRFDPVGIIGGLLAMISRTDTTSSLAYAPPTLLIEASEDKIIPSDTMKALATKIKSAEHVTLQGSGHVSMVEKPEAFTRALQSFLQTL